MTKCLMLVLTFCGTLQALPNYPPIWQSIFPNSKTMSNLSMSCMLCHLTSDGSSYTPYGNIIRAKLGAGANINAAILSAGDPGVVVPPPPPPPTGAITVSVNPVDVPSLEVGKTQSFTATVQGSAHGVTWTTSGGVGTIGGPAGNTVVFTATSVGNGSIVATSMQDGSKKAIATIRVVSVVPPPPPTGTATLKRHESHYAGHPTSASKDANQCKTCHGPDLKGTDLSAIHGDRIFISKNGFKGPKATVTDEVGVVYTSGGQLAVFTVGTKVACAFCHSHSF